MLLNKPTTKNTTIDDDLLLSPSPDVPLESLNESTKVKQALSIVSTHPDYKICKRVSEWLPTLSNDPTQIIATIVDLETTGLNPDNDQIIEIAILSLSFSKETGLFSIIDSYNALNDPNKLISEEITTITGITQNILQGQAINWERVASILSKTQYIICHNVEFDGEFLKKKTPKPIQDMVRSKHFACTLKDIDWNARGHSIKKLDYLNFKLGYFYDAHRALTDCWATLNVLREVNGATTELLDNAEKKVRLSFFKNKYYAKQDIHVSVQPTLPTVHPDYIPEELTQAVSILLDQPQYKIFQHIPTTCPSSIRRITIVDLKTTGNNPSEDQIVSIGLLSFYFSHDHGIVGVTQPFKSTQTPEQGIDWKSVGKILDKLFEFEEEAKENGYVISHQCGINRKFLESQTPDFIQKKVKLLYFASTTLDINWQARGHSNTTVNYLNYKYGFFYDTEDCTLTNCWATLNILKVAQGALLELENNINKKEVLFVATGTAFYDCRAQLKLEKFTWSNGKGKLSQGWRIIVSEQQAPDMIAWLNQITAHSKKPKYIYQHYITAAKHYSNRYEEIPSESKKRPLDDNEGATSSSVNEDDSNYKSSRISVNNR